MSALRPTDVQLCANAGLDFLGFQLVRIWIAGLPGGLAKIHDTFYGACARFAFVRQGFGITEYSPLFVVRQFSGGHDLMNVECKSVGRLQGP